MWHRWLCEAVTMPVLLLGTVHKFVESPQELSVQGKPGQNCGGESARKFGSKWEAAGQSQFNATFALLEKAKSHEHVLRFIILQFIVGCVELRGGSHTSSKSFVEKGSRGVRTERSEQITATVQVSQYQNGKSQQKWVCANSGIVQRELHRESKAREATWRDSG